MAVFDCKQLQIGTELDSVPKLNGVYASLISFQVTAFPLYGGILLPLAIGAVVDGVLTTSHTPLSGQFLPVLAVVVATCIHKHADLQSARFSTGINCVYPARKPGLIANEPEFIRFDLQSNATDQN